MTDDERFVVAMAVAGLYLSGFILCWAGSRFLADLWKTIFRIEAHVRAIEKRIGYEWEERL